MKEIQIYSFEENRVEILEIKDAPYFEIYSTGMALGYATTNSQGKTYPHKVRIDSIIKNAEIAPCVRDVHKYFSESQLYDFMLEARTEKCKSFKKWVTREVLPSIRETGVYSLPSYQIENPVKRAECWIKEYKEKLELIDKVFELEPKAARCDTVTDCEDAILTTVIAKDYGRTCQWLNEKLHELKIQYKRGDTWVLYKKYAGRGYAFENTYVYKVARKAKRPRNHMRWTQEGRKFIRGVLKSKGFVPLTEKQAGRIVDLRQTKENL